MPHTVSKYFYIRWAASQKNLVDQTFSDLRFLECRLYQFDWLGNMTSQLRVKLLSGNCKLYSPVYYGYLIVRTEFVLRMLAQFSEFELNLLLVIAKATIFLSEFYEGVIDE